MPVEDEHKDDFSSDKQHFDDTQVNESKKYRKKDIEKSIGNSHDSSPKEIDSTELNVLNQEGKFHQTLI